MKKVTIAGLPVNLVTEQEAEKAEIVICMRVADMEKPFGYAQISSCSKCKAPVWFSPFSCPVTPPKVCNRCSMGNLLDRPHQSHAE